MPINLLSRAAQSMRMPALAVTDRNNLFGALEFSETMAALGISPLLALLCRFISVQMTSRHAALHY